MGVFEVHAFTYSPLGSKPQLASTYARQVKSLARPYRTVLIRLHITILFSNNSLYIALIACTCNVVHTYYVHLSNTVL